MLLLPQGEKKNCILRFPHPPKPCLQSPHPVADRLSGVAARRGRRFGWRKDVRRHPEGSAETGLPPRRHGRSGGPVGPILPFSSPTGRRMCLCGTQGGGRASRGVCGVIPRFARCRWRPPACPQSPPSQRDRSRRHKPPNGAPEGVTTTTTTTKTEAASGAPSDTEIEPRRYDGRGRTCGRTARHFFSPGGRRSDFNILAQAKC